MHRIEAPGTTCLQSLAILKASHRTIRNDRKGCGAVMRLLPFALMLHDAFYSYTQVLDLAQYATALTHGHPEAEAATALYMSTVHALVHGIQPQFFDDLKTVEHITELGTGWTAMECLSMACYAVATSKTYDEMVIRAICHPGDSDSVAAVAGGLWALAGNTGFERFTDRLMHRRIIEELTA
jgi:ADP-ribosylglycohydrolase